MEGGADLRSVDTVVDIAKKVDMRPKPDAPHPHRVEQRKRNGVELDPSWKCNAIAQLLGTGRQARATTHPIQHEDRTFEIEKPNVVVGLPRTTTRSDQQ